MSWSICCSSLGGASNTFQSFLNVLTIKEFSQKTQVDVQAISTIFITAYFFGFQDTPQLRYSADYEVIKEQNIAEKISFLNKNLPQSSCVKVNSKRE